MKKTILLLTIFLSLSMGVFAQQQLSIRIFDPNNTNSQLYNRVGQLWDYSINPSGVMVEQIVDQSNYSISGDTQKMYFSYPVASDHNKLKYRVWVQNTSNNKYDEIWTGWFDSGQYYSGVGVDCYIP